MIRIKRHWRRTYGSCGWDVILIGVWNVNEYEYECLGDIEVLDSVKEERRERERLVIRTAQK